MTFRAMMTFRFELAKVVMQHLCTQKLLRFDFRRAAVEDQAGAIAIPFREAWRRPVLLRLTNTLRCKVHFGR
jgi:hypothetical protein